MKANPPGLFLRFFRWYCHPKLVAHIEGDLIEVYGLRLKKSGKRKADIEFVFDILLLFRPSIIKPIEGNVNLNNYGMIKSYFKIGLRSIFRQKLYSTINVLGLALGICACLVIYAISSYELSFDTFHPDRERIYRVIGDLTEYTGDKLQFSRLPVPLLGNAKTQLVGIESIAGLVPYNAGIKIEGTAPAVQFDSHAAGTHYITTVIAEPEYFKIFNYQWLEGSPTNALASSLSVVLTEKRAAEYFGSMPLGKIIGKQIIYEDSLTAIITGIVKDWEGNTDLGFTDFISFASLQNNFLKRRIDAESWKQGDMPCYIFTKLLNKIEPDAINKQFAKIVKSHASEIKLIPWLEPISNIHFNASIIENPIRTAHLPTLYSLIGIAVFLLFLAVVNFVNLSTAQSIQRAKEVGVRKVMGSSRMSLSFQFMTETFLLTVIGASLAILWVDPILNEFKSFVPTGFSFHFFQSSTIVFFVSIILITTLLSGFYPASVLSSYLPALNLKGVGSKSVNEKWLLRKGLIVFQFSVSLVFIIGSIVISKQLNYTREKELGFTADAILVVETPRGDRIDKISRLYERVKSIPGVKNIALQWVPPMALNGRGRSIKFKSTDEEAVGVVQLAGSEEFIPLYEIKLLAGRNLAHADSLTEFVINENLSRLMGCKNPSDALGKILYWDNKPYPVVGVVSDFHTRSFHEAIAPLCIVNRPDRERTLAIKLSSKGKQSDLIKNTLTEIEKKWNEIYPETPFGYSFYDDSLAQIYESDQRTAMLINISMVIAIFISCIGLFGITLFTSEKRSKEISIRKILGASIANIVVMLSMDFVLLVVIALIIASPIALYFVNQWLRGFAYHININWSVFALAGVCSLFITLITVSYQSIQAALTNPVKNLRSE
jgi:putative ABC transport system permease protein